MTCMHIVQAIKPFPSLIRDKRSFRTEVPNLDPAQMQRKCPISIQLSLIHIRNATKADPRRRQTGTWQLLQVSERAQFFWWTQL